MATWFPLIVILSPSVTNFNTLFLFVLKVKLLFEVGSQILIGGQVTGAKSGGELINAISACIHQRMTADDIATFQTGTHPALTASPIAYQLVNAAELAIGEMRKKSQAPHL